MKSPCSLVALLLMAGLHLGCASQPAGISREQWARLTPAQREERLRAARQSQEVMTDRDVQRTHKELIRQAEALPKIRLASETGP